MLRARAVGIARVAVDYATYFGDFDGVGQFFERDHFHVATRREIAGHIEHVSHAATHAGGEVASRRAKHDDAAAGHVFAAVVADALDDRAHAGVAHAESLAGHAADVSLAARRAVK